MVYIGSTGQLWKKKNMIITKLPLRMNAKPITQDYRSTYENKENNGEKNRLIGPFQKEHILVMRF